VLEPITYVLNAALAQPVSHHFQRMRMIRVADDAATDRQFELSTMLDAARVLAEAPLDALVWNGTSASWRGLESDRAFADAVRAETGLACTTSTIAILNAFRRHNWTRIALAVPYVDAINTRIVSEYARHGIEVAGVASLGIESNVEIGALAPATIRALITDAARCAPDCIAVVCTNLAATPLVAELEASLGIPIVDSIAATFLDACRTTGVCAPVDGWGYILANP
jgi:maleate isomerase